MDTPRCPRCRGFVFTDVMACPDCGTELGFHPPTLSMRQVQDRVAEIDSQVWRRCQNSFWRCNWLVAEADGAAVCMACRMTRERPDREDTVALEKLADVEESKRRLIMQLLQLDIPITPFYDAEGGLGFDLLSSFSGKPVMIGHANGIITIDLAESLDAYRESIRVRLAEPYRTVLGHFRHEVGHYLQNVLITDDETWARCRELFGDERASYSDALDRHYKTGAPDGWQADFISEYATMHPWEDFAETFAHYLHITGTLWTAWAAGLKLRPWEPANLNADVLDDQQIEPLQDYRDSSVDIMIEDWRWVSMFFNRVNRSMGQRDIYPFTLPIPVIRKLAFVHTLVVGANTGARP